MHFLACNGAVEIVADFRCRISALEDVGPSPVNGRDRALDNQRQAARLADLMSNEPLLAAARTRAQHLQANCHSEFSVILAHKRSCPVYSKISRSTP